MKKLSIDLKLKDINLDKSLAKKSGPEICVEVIKNIMLSWANQKGGMNEIDRRLFYKTCDALEKAVKDKVNIVSLEDASMGFIRKCKLEGMIVPNDLVRRVEILIDAVENR